MDENLLKTAGEEETNRYGGLDGTAVIACVSGQGKPDDSVDVYAVPKNRNGNTD